MADNERSMSRRGVLAGLAGAATVASIGGVTVAGAAPAGAAPGDPVDGRPTDGGALGLTSDVLAASSGLDAALTYLMIPGPAFSVNDGSAINWSAGVYSTATLRAYPQLPIGSTIVEIEAYRGNGSTAAIALVLREWIPDPLDNNDIFTINLNATSVITTVAPLPVTKNGAFYMFEATGTSVNAQLVGVRVGYIPPAGAFVPVTQTRKLDTRAGAKLAKGTTTTVNLASQVPAGAKAALISLTATETVGALGYFTAFPGSSATPPDTSNLNWFANGQVVANTAVVSLGGGSTIKLFVGGATDAATHALVDVIGYFK